MRQAGRIVAETLALLQQKIRPGITTADLDAVAESAALQHGAIPSFKGYRGYPASVCVSINEEVVHGIPSPHRALQEGDIVSLDYGVIYNGYHGDAAITVPVGKVSPVAQRLIEATEGSLYVVQSSAQRLERLLESLFHAVSLVAAESGFRVLECRGPAPRGGRTADS